MAEMHTSVQYMRMGCPLKRTREAYFGGLYCPFLSNATCLLTFLLNAAYNDIDLALKTRPRARNPEIALLCYTLEYNHQVIMGLVRPRHLLLHHNYVHTFGLACALGSTVARTALHYASGFEDAGSGLENGGLRFCD